MRHAKSDWNIGTSSDFDRVLSERGNIDAPRMGQWLVNQGYSPDQVICSTAQRVKETIALVSTNWKQDEDQIIWEPAIYNASLSQLLGTVAAEIKQGQITLLTGHNPGVSELILHLGGDCIPIQASGNLMPTSAITALELTNINNIIDYGSWKIVDYMKPANLAHNYKNS